LTLDPAKESLVKPPTKNIEAYNTYLKGLFHANKWTAMDAEIAIREFERALEMEPEFILPYSRLSTLYVYLGATGKKPKKEAIAKTKEYALKALEIDNQAAESHEALANLYFFHEWDWNKVNQSLEKALELNPNLPGAYLTRAMNFAIHTKFDEAFEAMQMSIQLDPFSAHGHYAYAAILSFAGKLKESSDELDKVFDISPQFPDALSLKGLIHQLQGDFEKAQKLFTEVKRVPGFEMNANASLGALNEIMGNPKIALDYLEKLLSAEETETGHDISFNIAYIYAYLDKPDEMFQYLNKSIDKKDISVLYIQVLPSFKKYYQDPRFDKLVKRLGLSK
jgi:tetratricopeptide (TPR) repeat protein